MRRIGRLAEIAARFRTETGGNFAIATAALASVLVVGAGFAVNTAQLHAAHSRLSHALDAAVTSTARDITTGRIRVEDAGSLVETFLAANAGDVSPVLDRLVVDRAANTVEAAASAEVALFFPVFGQSGTRTVRTSTAALYSDKAIEVAMMLDITGSMSGQKIKDLKTAATNAVDAFLGGQDPQNPRVRVSIVPYADAVNVGTLSTVVHAETRFTTAEPPRLDDPVAASAASAPDRCATERKGRQQFTDAGPYTAMVNRDYRLAFCPASAMRPLTADIKALKDTIRGFVASGHTGGHMGIQWSWYMLSPRWKDVLPKAARPAANDPKRVAKYAILMTDGEFNTAFAGVGRDGDTRSQPALSRRHAETLCTAMRKDGIEIFTVGFMLKEAGARGVMKNCASPDTSSIRHHFDTASGAELNDAFLEIARNIERLALTK